MAQGEEEKRDGKERRRPRVRGIRCMMEEKSISRKREKIYERRGVMENALA